MSRTTPNSRLYIKRKRNKEDFCNICGVKSKLTFDHVPPKCCFNDVNIKPLETLSGEKEKYNPNCSQNGLKYRSLCGECNNGLLAKYDKSVEDVVEQIKNHFLTSNLKKENVINLKIKINAFAKSICGHFLAMKNSYDNQCVTDILLRKYVLDPCALPPEDHQLLIRFYPYSTVFAIRDVAIHPNHIDPAMPKGMISILSSFPIAYILNSGSDSGGFIDLFRYCSENINETIELKLDIYSAFHTNTNMLRHEKWPCNITDDISGTSILICSAHAASDSIYGNRDNKILVSRLQNTKK